MLYGLLVTLFTLMSLFLVLLIMLQRGKRSLGLGGMGGGTQMLFGGSGGQELFQKMTWILGAIFVFGGLALAIMKTAEINSARFIGRSTPVAESTTNDVSEPCPAEEANEQTS